ncbi:MAG: hypothetical protein ACJ8DC_18355 [Gemmatimonadales bacterium]
MADSGSDTKSSLIRQILPAVLVALLVGTSSPWWLKLFVDKGVVETHALPASGQPTGDRAAAANGSGDAGTPPAPQPDFPEGSRPVYGAEFSTWPTNTTEHGSAGPSQGEYVIQPLGNTWVGPGRLIDMLPLEADFVFDVNFRMAERDPSSALWLDLYGSGNVAPSITFFLEVWGHDNATYSLQTGTLKDNLYATRDKEIASRVLLPASVVASDWSGGNKITLRRKGGTAYLFVNDTYIVSFAVPVFAVSRLSVSGAFKSKISLSSIQARIPN